MLRCPNCRANNPGTNQCRRCGLELVVLQDIETTTKRLTLQALQLLTTSDSQHLTAIKNLLLNAYSLQHDPLIKLLLEFVNADTETIAQETLQLPLNGEWLH